jgi:antitoxin ParD1/3/4
MPHEPSTVTMNVSLPEPLKEYVDGKVSSGVYGSASEFVREAIREKLQREKEREEARGILAGKLLQGLDSGTSIPFNQSYIKAKKAALVRRVNLKRK